MILENNYSNWNNAKISLEKIVYKASGTDYYIDDWDWSNSIENTLKIKDNNNLKQFQILNIRNTFYFNLKKIAIKERPRQYRKEKIGPV